MYDWLVSYRIGKMLHTLPVHGEWDIEAALKSAQATLKTGLPEGVTAEIVQVFKSEKEDDNAQSKLPPA